MILKNARIIEQDNQTKMVDILIEDNKITKIDQNINGENIIDLENKLVMSGGIDVHVHLREPGFENKETIETGSNAASRGGYTTIMAMPNIKPSPSNIENMNNYQHKLDQQTNVNIIPYCTITKNEAGKELVDFKNLINKGYLYFSDDGVGLNDPKLMKEAMKITAENGGMIVAHCEDKSLLNDKASLNEGKISEKFNVNGINNVSEYSPLKRDLLLVEETKAKYHMCHMSCKESVDLMRKAKQKGLDVSGEVSAHHLLLNENDVKDTNYKMNPPLRSVEDQQALLKGIQDGTIEIIASDHAPHTIEDKAKPMEDASFGIIGLETTIPLIYTYLVKNNDITLQKFEELISKNPAKRFGLNNKGEIAVGYDADLVILDDKETIIDKNKMYSKASNTPFDQWKVDTDIYMTIKDGKIVYQKEDI